MGKLGFIAEFSKREFFDDGANIIKNGYHSRKIYLFQASVIDQNKKSINKKRVIIVEN